MLVMDEQPGQWDRKITESLHSLCRKGPLNIIKFNPVEMSRDIFNMNMFIFKLNELGRVQTTATASGSGAHAGNSDFA